MPGCQKATTDGDSGVAGEEVESLFSAKAYTEAEEGPRVDFLERKLRAQPPGDRLALQPQAGRAGLARQEAPGLAGMTRPGRCFDLPSLSNAGL